MNNKFQAGKFGRRLRTAKMVLSWLFITIVTFIAWAFYTNCTGQTGEGSCGQTYVDKISYTAFLIIRMLFANAENGTEKMEILRLIAPFVMPLFTVLAFFTALRVQLKLNLLRLRQKLPFEFLRSKSELVVIIGLGHKGLEHAKSVSASDENCILTVLEKDPENPNTNEIESINGIVWVGDAMYESDLQKIFWKRPTKVWILTGNSHRNLLILEKVRNYLKSRVDGSSRVNVYAGVEDFAERRDAGTLKSLNRDDSSVWTHLFNHEESVAAWLLSQIRVLPHSQSKLPPRVLIIGLGSLGRAILRELLVLCHFPRLRGMGDCRTEIVTVDQSQLSFEKLENEIPFLKSLNSENTTLISIKKEIADAQKWGISDYVEKVRKNLSFTHVFVDVGTDAENLAVAMRLAAWEEILKAKDNQDIKSSIVPILKDKKSSQWYEKDDRFNSVFLFEVDDTYSPHALKWNGWIESIAQHANAVYHALDDIPPKDIISCWTSISEHDRLSNLALARYTYNRWWDSKNQLWNDVEDEKSEIECEHRRWNAFKLHENVEPFILKIDDKIIREYARVHHDLYLFDDLNREEVIKDERIIKHRDYIKVANPKNTSFGLIE